MSRLNIKKPEKGRKTEEEKRKTLMKAMGIFVVIIMSGSVIGFVTLFNSNEENAQSSNIQYPYASFDVSGYTFYNLGDGTYGTVLPRFTGPDGNPLQIAFNLDPREAYGIYIDNNTVDVISSSSKVYIAVNPNYERFSDIVVAATEVSRVIPLSNGFVPVTAYTEDSDPIDETRPIRTCKDANEGVAVITFEITGNTQVTAEDYCVKVEGANAEELVWAADKLGMNLVGIII